MSRHGMGAAGLLTAGFIISLGLLPERAASVDAACGAAHFAGTWRNVAPVEGSDVIAADIRVHCGERSDLQPKVEIALKVRCLRYECAWQPVTASWTGDAGTAPSLTAAYREDRVERSILVEPPKANRLRLSVTTRFLKVPIDPRLIVYEMERADD